MQVSTAYSGLRNPTTLAKKDCSDQGQSQENAWRAGAQSIQLISRGGLDLQLFVFCTVVCEAVKDSAKYCNKGTGWAEHTELCSVHGCLLQGDQG